MTDATLRVHLNIGPSARDCRVTCEVTRDDSSEPAGYAVELISSDVELDHEWEQVELEAIDEAKRIWAERKAS